MDTSREIQCFDGDGFWPAEIVEAIAQRDEQIKKLGEKIAAHDKVVKERDEQIQGLRQDRRAQEHEINDLKHVVMKLTKMKDVEEAQRLVERLAEVTREYDSYREDSVLRVDHEEEVELARKAERERIEDERVSNLAYAAQEVAHTLNTLGYMDTQFFAEQLQRHLDYHNVDLFIHTMRKWHEVRKPVDKNGKPVSDDEYFQMMTNPNWGLP